FHHHHVTDAQPVAEGELHPGEQVPQGALRGQTDDHTHHAGRCEHAGAEAADRFEGEQRQADREHGDERGGDPAQEHHLGTHPARLVAGDVLVLEPVQRLVLQHVQDPGHQPGTGHDDRDQRHPQQRTPPGPLVGRRRDRDPGAQYQPEQLRRPVDVPPDAGHQRQPPADPPQHPVGDLDRPPPRQHGEQRHRHRTIGVPAIAPHLQPVHLPSARLPPVSVALTYARRVRRAAPSDPAGASPAGAKIRGYRPADAPALYHICLRTGDRGGDATGLYADPYLLGHVYVGPYLALAPRFAFVLDAGGPVGYALGVPDTAELARACERSWWPPLRRRYPDPARVPGHRRTPDQQVAMLIHRPPVPDPAVLALYPAHLHIDLLPVAQGQGYGRALMERLLAEL